MGVLFVFTAVGCGTTKNPEFCCLTEADCAQFGVTEFRSCTEGLACIENSCQPASCAMGTCTAAMPVCEIATDMCVGCSTSNDCTRFSATPVCDDAGSCVECVDGGDCPASKPICDAKQCRVCAADDDCLSGACAVDGTCVDEGAAIYLATTGANVAPCSKGAPCATLDFGLSQATSSREHVVMAPGNYSGTGTTTIPATRIYIHGHGARVTGGNSDVPTLRTNIPTTISDLQLVNIESEGIALATVSTTTLERAQLRGGKPLSVRALTTLVDTDIEATHTGITSVNATLILDRVRVRGGDVVGVDVYGGTMDFTNVAVFETGGVGLNLSNTSGFIKFTTVANTGRGGGTGPFGAHCEIANVVFQGSIVWNNFGAARLPIDGSCTQFVSTIAGPAAVAGTMNANPQLANEVGNDFHLGSSSPARDSIDTGPPIDLDGSPRPRGVKYDLGAFEAQ